MFGFGYGKTDALERALDTFTDELWDALATKGTAVVWRKLVAAGPSGVREWGPAIAEQIAAGVLEDFCEGVQTVEVYEAIGGEDLVNAIVAELASELLARTERALAGSWNP